MARRRFGGDINAWAFISDPTLIPRLTPGGTITCWSAIEGGTQYFDLALDRAGVSRVTTVTTMLANTASPGQFPVFYGPPDDTKAMWVSVNGGPRTLLVSNDLTNLAALSDMDPSRIPAGSILTAVDGSGTVGWAAPASNALTREAYLRGVNFSGLEFSPSTLPGTLSTDFFQPAAGDYAYARANGLTVARIPFLWERAQQTLNGPLDEPYMTAVDTAIRNAADAGMRVVLDQHGYGRRFVWFPGGFTEPFTSTTGTWSGGTISSGRYITDQATYFTKITGGDPRNPVAPASGYAFSVDCYITAELTGGSNFPALWIRAYDNLLPTATASYYQVSLDRYGQLIKWSKIVNGVATAIGQTSATISLNTLYTVVIDVNQLSAGNVVVKVNGTTHATFPADPGLTGGRVSIATSFTKASIDNATLNVAGDTTGSAASAAYRIGDAALPVAAFADLWSRIATRYANETAVWAYDLCNEPHDMPTPTTTANFNTTATATVMQQAALAAVRVVDPDRWVIWSLDQWSGFQSFVGQYGTDPNPWWTDPSDRTMVGAHYYLDVDHAGSYTGGAATWTSTLRTRLPGEVTPLLSWAAGRGLHVFAGEYGVPYATGSDADNWRTDLGTFLGLLDTYGAHGTYWAMGNNYTAATSVQPRTSGVTDYSTDALQMAVLTAHLGARALAVPSDRGGTGLTRPGTAGNVLTSTGTSWTSTAPAAAVSAAGIWLPAHNGLLAASFDPAASVNSSALTAGVLSLIKIPVLAAAGAISTIHIYIVTAGSGLTSGQCFAALIDSTGTRVAVSADQATAWASTGAKQITLTAAYTPPANGYVYAVLLSNGTTGPAIARGASSGSQAGNVGLTSGTYRFGSYGTAQTAVPSTVTLASMTNGTGFFVGLS